MKSKSPSLVVVLCALFLLNACKKEGASKGKVNMVQLGNLKTDLYSNIFFNFSGQPILQANNFLYEWSEAENKWTKLADVIPGGGGFMNMVQDKKGDYYGVYWKWLFILNKTTNQWDTVKLEHYEASTNEPYLLMSESGDMLVRTRDYDNFYYFKKDAEETTWTKFKELPKAQEDTRFPYYLTNNGLVYYSYDSRHYPGGTMCDIMMDMNTGTFGKLFDKGDPDNAEVMEAYNFSGNLPTTYITPEGLVYIMNSATVPTIKCNLHKITPANLPAKIQKVQDFDRPVVSGDGSGWFTYVSLGNFSVDASGGIKMYLYCSHYPDAHWAEATARIGSSKIDYYGHPLGQRGIITNLKGDAYVSVLNGYIYKWN